MRDRWVFTMCSCARRANDVDSKAWYDGRTGAAMAGRPISGRKGEPMSTLNLSQSDITAHDGTPVRLVYDPEADMLEIFFGTNEPATGVELTDHIVLRLNLQTKRAVSLLLMVFSILTERTEYGPRSYPLTTLHTLPGEVRAVVLQVVTSMPVKQFLKVSHFQVSRTESVPLTYTDLRRSATVKERFIDNILGAPSTQCC